MDSTKWRIGDAGHTVFGPNLGQVSPEIIATNLKRDNAKRIVQSVNGYGDALDVCRLVLEDMAKYRGKVSARVFAQLNAVIAAHSKDREGSSPSDALRELASLYGAEGKKVGASMTTVPKRGRPRKESNMANTTSRSAKRASTETLLLFPEAVQEAERVEESEPVVELAVERKVDPRNRMNALTSKEWIPETVSVWTQRGLGAAHADARIERQHPAPFSFTDVARLVRLFSKPGDTVLDPFVGVGSTLKACAMEGRRGVGVELNPRYVELARERLSKEVRGDNQFVGEQKIIQGDSREVLAAVEADSFDFVVTSPPYWSILHKEDHKAKQERKDFDLDTRYSDDSRDLGNIKDYSSFLGQLSEILGECGRVLKRKKYMAVVVSDFRDKSKFIMFHADLARDLESRKFGIRGIKVLYQRHKRIFPYGYPYAYVPNIHHQYILILQNER